MNASKIAVSSLAISILGILGVLMFFFQVAPDYRKQNLDPHPLSDLEARAVFLDEKIRELSAELSALESAKKETVLATPTANNHADDALQRRLDELSKKLIALEGETSSRHLSKNASESVDHEVEATLRSSMARDALDAYRAKFSDSTSDLAMRLAALRMLRKFPDEMNAREGEVVDVALELVDTLQDPSRRQAILREMAGVKDERFLERLLKLVREDPNENVRRQALNALSRFMDDPRVSGVIEEISRKDPSQGVKREAVWILQRIDKE